MEIAIYGSRRQYGSFDYIAAFLGELAGRSCRVVMHPKLYRHLYEAIPGALEGVECVDTNATIHPDMAVSLGGDGTFLRTVKWLAPDLVPIVGVNTGHLGYLAALSIEQLPYLPQMIVDDCLRVEHRSALQVLTPELPPEVGCYALNEVAILKEESASMISAEVKLGDTPLAEYRADGLVLCTSTGSTAYNLSVGGPLVEPTLGVSVIAPIAAHSLSMRPLVAGLAEPATIIPRSRARHVRLALDGRSAVLPEGTPVVVARAPFTVPVMQLAAHTFADTLRDKLHWGEA